MQNLSPCLLGCAPSYPLALGSHANRRQPLPRYSVFVRPLVLVRSLLRFRRIENASLQPPARASRRPASSRRHLLPVAPRSAITLMDPPSPPTISLATRAPAAVCAARRIETMATRTSVVQTISASSPPRDTSTESRAPIPPGRIPPVSSCALRGSVGRSSP
jgi:hypothetical protein